MVKDTSLKTNRLLTLVPLNQNCPLTACPSTKDILNNLFLALQHPYICPVFQVDFLKYEDQTYIVLLQPINQGSLKDLIHGVSASWHRNIFNSSEESEEIRIQTSSSFFLIDLKLILIYFFTLMKVLLDTILSTLIVNIKCFNV